MCPTTAAKSVPEEAAHGEAVICVSAHYSVSMHILTLLYSKLCYHGSPHMESQTRGGDLKQPPTGNNARSAKWGRGQLLPGRKRHTIIKDGKTRLHEKNLSICPKCQK